MARTLAAMVKRRLREGKTYEDFRRAWYHRVGFGAPNQMLTVLNAADPREVIVIALTEVREDQIGRLLSIDAEERTDNPLDQVIEPEIERTFGILIAEDDFSSAGAIPYCPATVNGVETDLAQVADAMGKGRTLLAQLRHGSRGAKP